MTMQSDIRTVSMLAKCGVQQHGTWLAINSLNSDRTPEGYFTSGFLEGSGYA
jgi:hypothetical protein